MNIVIEKNIPYIKGAFEKMGVNVSYLAPEQIDAAAMANADALITRTRTRCDAALLSSSKCKMIASATIGLDHIDTAWCRAHGIGVANAPGCNAPAVAQYVLRAILQLLPDKQPGDLTLGIVGVGNVGKIVEKWARSLGMKVLLCDPPRAEKEGYDNFCPFEQIAREADIITFHTPLTTDSPHATYHLADFAFFNSLTHKPVIINSSRGAVVDNEALVYALRNNLVADAAIDTWENEPQINHTLLELAAVATPHIAGYSASGKIRATKMAAEAVCRHFNLPLPQIDAPCPAPVPETTTKNQLIDSYDIASDTAALKKAPGNFEQLRNYYNLRLEPIETKQHKI